jgi:dihydroorotate dehydrogenase (NAD+) catalytic subunit
MVDMTVQLGALRAKSPVFVASGTFGYGTELADFVDLSLLGGVCSKGLSLVPRPGNPPPRIAETPAGMLNAIGLENVGIDRFISEKVPAFRDAPCAMIANIFGVTVDEYVELARRLDGVPRVDALEINISCPNVKAGGVTFGRDPSLAAEVTRAVRRATKKPLIVKLSPNTADIAEVGRAVEAEGADAVSVINTITAMAIDVRKRRPVLGNMTGGLSGPAIRPIAVRMVYECFRALRIPIMGIGGIMTAGDALEFILAGAACVQVGTASFVDPSAAARVFHGIRSYLAENHFTSVRDLVGEAVASPVTRS